MRTQVDGEHARGALVVDAEVVRLHVAVHLHMSASLSGLVEYEADAAAVQDAHPAAPVDALQRRQHSVCILRAMHTVSGLLACTRCMQPSIAEHPSTTSTI